MDASNFTSGPLDLTEFVPATSAPVAPTRAQPEAPAVAPRSLPLPLRAAQAAAPSLPIPRPVSPSSPDRNGDIYFVPSNGVTDFVPGPSRGPSPERAPSDKGIVTDTGNLLGQGAAQTVGAVSWIANKLTGGKADAFAEEHFGRGFTDMAKDVSDHYLKKMTPEMQAASEKEWISSDADKTIGPAFSDPRAYMATIVKSLPALVATAGPLGSSAKFTSSAAKKLQFELENASVRPLVEGGESAFPTLNARALGPGEVERRMTPRPAAPPQPTAAEYAESVRIYDSIIAAHDKLGDTETVNRMRYFAAKHPEQLPHMLEAIARSAKSSAAVEKSWLLSGRVPFIGKLSE